MRALSLALILLAGITATACSKPSTAAEPRDFCARQQFQGSRFTVCTNHGGELRLFAAGRAEMPPRSFAEIARRIDQREVAFAMNAGMFDDQGRPIGMAQTANGQIHKLNVRDGGGNFHLKPNGVFMVTCGGAPAIFRSDAIPQFRCAPRLATQSGPMLVIDGRLHPKLQPDGDSRYVRNGVGVRGQESLFVISEEPVSLGKFARFFRDGLKAPNALYFDGSVSSLWDPAAGRQDSHSALGPIIVAFKPAESAPGRGGRARP
jgi:uncharacterized protein YigE (DUF2233 family)